MRKTIDGLKPCPYKTCGSMPVLIGDEIDTPDGWYQIECEDCCASGPACSTIDAAIQEWNAIERHEPSQTVQATCTVCAGKGTLYDPFDRTTRICEICQPVGATAVDLRQILIKVETLQGFRVPVDLLRHLNKIESDLQAAIKWITPVVKTKEQP